MDNVTHTLFGVALARAGLARRYGRGTTLVLALASNVPDVDGLYALVAGGDMWLHRRIATHGLPMLPVVSLVAALLLRPLAPRLRLAPLFLLCLLGTLGHTALDLLNSFGVVLLWPFRATRFELGWTFVIDLMCTALLAWPLVPMRAAPERRARLALAFLAGYLGFCALARQRAQDLVAARGLGPAAGRRQATFPELLGAHRFRIAVERDGRWDEILCNVLTGTCAVVRSVVDQASDARVRAARATPAGATLEWFFAAPVWQITPEGAAVEVFDLRFTSAVWPRGRPFLRRLPLPR